MADGQGWARAWLSAACVVLMVSGLFAVDATHSAAGAAGVCGPPVTSVIACENTKPGDPPRDWQRDGLGRPHDPGLRDAMSVKPRRHGSFKVNATVERVPRRHPALRLLPGQRRAEGRRRSAGPRRCRRPSRRALTDAADRTDRLRQLGGVGVRGPSRPTAVSGIYLAHLVRNDTAAAQPRPVRRARRRQPLRHRLPDIGHDVAGVQHLRRQQPLHVHRRLPARQSARRTRARTRSRTTGRSTRADDDSGTQLADVRRASR